jgi:SAM-dependent methyltransferase
MPRPTKRTKARTAASYCDRHDLYQRAVQCVEAEIDFVDRTYKRLRDRRAVLLREDFCGTANTSCEWVRRRKTNRAVGLDIHHPTLEWGRKHNLSTLTEEQRSRLDLRQVSVLDQRDGEIDGGFDAVLAMNFSYWCFKDRPTLLRYFRAVHGSLASDGVFFLDFYGGPDALREIQEKRRIGARPGGGHGSPPFTYVWDQARYDPISGDILCYIHFRFADGSEIKRAFTYDWRLWTIPELRDVLVDAGFSPVTVYWEGDDDKGGGDGIFRPRKHGEACPAYIAYIVAEK